jgi:hypothetical protein
MNFRIRAGFNGTILKFSFRRPCPMDNHPLNILPRISLSGILSKAFTGGGEETGDFSRI